MVVYLSRVQKGPKVASEKEKVNANNLQKEAKKKPSQKKQAQGCYKTVWFCNNFLAAGQ